MARHWLMIHSVADARKNNRENTVAAFLKMHQRRVIAWVLPHIQDSAQARRAGHTRRPRSSQICVDAALEPSGRSEGPARSTPARLQTKVGSRSCFRYIN